MKVNFICENNLGKLAKWMSILGFDIIYDKSGDVELISNIASSDSRTILTTRTDFEVYKKNNVIVQIQNDDFELQLVQILKNYNFKKNDLNVFSRCYNCNTETITIDRLDYGEKIPPRAYEFGENFRICRTCEQIYWLGSHYTEILKYIDMIYLKYFSICRRCGVTILRDHTKYNTLINIKSMYDRLDLDDSISEVEINKSIEEIIGLIEKMSFKELNNDVYYREEFLLCSVCQRKMIMVINDFLECKED